MKRLISILTTFSILLTVCAGSFSTSAQQSSTNQDPFAAPRRPVQMHPKAVIGSTPERKAAWERLTPEQRKEVQEKFRAIVAEAKQKAEQEKDKSNVARKTWQDVIRGKQSSTEADLTLVFTDKQGNRRLLKAKERAADATLSATPSSQARLEKKDSQLAKAAGRQSQALWSNVFGFAAFKKASFVKASATTMAQSGDADFDGLPEDFENAVADAFTPFYHISGGEPDNFAIFGNFVPQTVQQRVGPNPISYFRVQPLGFAYNAFGQLVSVLRIDYLTLWDHDSGLPGSILCDFDFGLGFLLEGARAHNIDNERSAVLVAAPVADYSYNLNPNAYSAYSFFTTAHEGVWFFDQSRYYDFPYQPVPAGNHIELALSRSKHGTYTFNPNYYPFTHPYIIYLTYRQIDDLYYYGYIDYYTYLALLYAADGFFYGCIVERFDDQGGRYAEIRINVGEPLNPINNSTFIQDNTYGLYDKLIRALW